MRIDTDPPRNLSIIDSPRKLYTVELVNICNAAVCICSNYNTVISKLYKKLEQIVIRPSKIPELKKIILTEWYLLRVSLSRAEQVSDAPYSENYSEN